MNKNSLIGKKYIPKDNSWSVNVTFCGHRMLRDSDLGRRYLAGNYNNDKKECTIVSEPFRCTVRTGISSLNNVKTASVDMIMVNYNNETHMVMYFESGVVDASKLKKELIKNLE